MPHTLSTKNKHIQHQTFQLPTVLPLLLCFLSTPFIIVNDTTMSEEGKEDANPNVNFDKMKLYNLINDKKFDV